MFSFESEQSFHLKQNFIAVLYIAVWAQVNISYKFIF